MSIFTSLRTAIKLTTGGIFAAEAVSVLTGDSRTTQHSEAGKLSVTPTAKPDTQTTAPVSQTTTPVVADTASTIPLNDLLAKVVQPNPLNRFHQPKYHFRLFSMSDANLIRYGDKKTPGSLLDQIESQSKVIIAETGVTTYNIHDVEITATVGPNPVSRNVNATKITITITEPMGVGFLEALRAAAIKTNVYNLNKCFYYLDLKFMAYTTDGEIELAPLKNMGLANGGRWLWQLQITDIDTTMDSAGGTYILTCIPWNEQFLEDEVLRTPEFTKISGGTIGAVLGQFKDALNKSFENKYGGKIVTFDVVTHPIDVGPSGVLGKDPASFSIKPQQPDMSSARGLSMTSTGTPSISIQAGTSITDAIEYALANVEQAQDMALDRNGNTTQTRSTATNVNDRNIRETIVFRIEPDITIEGYDYTNEQYIRHVTLHIWGFYTSRVINDSLQRDDAQDPKIQEKIFRSAIDKGFVSKRYDYINTGLNTEVLNFDIKYNMAWAAVLPSIGGARAGYDQTTVGPRASANVINPEGNRPEAIELTINKARDASTRLQQQLAGANNDLLKSEQALNDAKKSLADAAPDANATTAVGGAVATATKNVADMTNTRDKLVKLSEAARLNVNNLYKANRPQGEVNFGKLYSEDLIKGANGLSRIDASRPYGEPQALVSLVQEKNTPNDTAGTGNTGQFHRDKTLFGAVLEQLYEPSVKQFFNLNITVRGDPYWIGFSNVDRQALLRSDAKRPLTEAGGLPDFTRGDYYLVVSFKYPIGQNDDFTPIFLTQNTFNGIYAATKVTSIFSDGDFKQHIEGVRHVLVELAKATSNSTTNNTSPVRTTSSPEAAGSSPPPISGSKTTVITNTTASKTTVITNTTASKTTVITNTTATTPTAITTMTTEENMGQTPASQATKARLDAIDAKDINVKKQSVPSNSELVVAPNKLKFTIYGF